MSAWSDNELADYEDVVVAVVGGIYESGLCRLRSEP